MDLAREPTEFEYKTALQSSALNWERILSKCADDKDREAVIIDDDNVQGNDSSQSDLVRIAMNLAYIDKDRLRKVHKFASNGFGFEGLQKNGLAEVKRQNVIHHKSNSGSQGQNYSINSFNKNAGNMVRSQEPHNTGAYQNQ